METPVLNIDTSIWIALVALVSVGRWKGHLQIWFKLANRSVSCLFAFNFYVQALFLK